MCRYFRLVKNTLCIVRILYFIMPRFSNEDRSQTRIKTLQIQTIEHPNENATGGVNYFTGIYFRENF
jgi:hypothetical protein